jgi:transcription elongation factor Elf1
MKTFPNDAKKIKITFVCDVCGVDTVAEATLSATCELVVNSICETCSKEFAVKIFRNNEKSWVEIEDVSDSDIKIEVL